MAAVQPSQSQSSSSSSRLIPISHLDDHFYVWSAADVLHLRSHHRIIGILTGSLPLLPQQNAYLGLPLELMPEEVGLLLQRGVAILVDDAQAHASPTRAQWQRWTQQREDDIHAQRQRAHTASVQQKRKFEEALKTTRQNVSGKQGAEQTSTAAHGEEAEGQKVDLVQEKRELRQKEKARLQHLEDRQGDRDGQDMPSSALDHPNVIADEPVAVDLSSYNYSHTTYDSSSSLPWYTAPTSPTALDKSPLNLDTTKQAVFTHLNTSRGFYLSCGLRFGGDFVAYPGDPFRYHSHYTITVPRDEEEGFEVGRLIAQGRLGTAVKKVHLIATKKKVDDAARLGKDEDSLSLYSLTWAGFGT